jgi:MFS transporter, AAHS family, vanillate permease
MGTYAIVIVALCVAINLIDGYDILAVAYTSPAFAREWALGPERVGFLLSAGLAGIGLGALVFSFVADTIGRRPVILICIALMTIGMVATAFSESLAFMAACRVVTGLGIGGMAPAAGTLAMEYSPPSRRTLSVALVVIGYPVGATLGGYIANALLAHFGWRSVFAFGGLLSLMLMPLLVWRMPESLEFLTDRQPRNALAKINRYRARLRLEPLAALPAAASGAARANGRLGDLVRPPLQRATIVLCLAYAGFMFSFYFILNWTTKLLTDMGLADATGVSISTLMNLGGIVGGLLLGILSIRVPLKGLAIGVVLLMSVAIASFGSLPPQAMVLGAASIVLGFFMWAGSASAYSVIALSYPPRVRASGIGLVITVGRAGSMLGPYTAGVLLEAGMGRGELTLLLAVPGALCALLFACVRPGA